MKSWKVICKREVTATVDTVPHHIRRKLLSWVQSVEQFGIEAVRKLPGYHDEPLAGRRKGQRSIRLSLSFRAIYTVLEGDKVNFVRLMEVTKHGY
ncbi:MAG: hypothetical protein DCC75_09885 [Proteobacteria bacterium]|nr:MAG: hypothetical protein DCC75_09885 [Pseudomonadota bacterium]